MVWLLLRTDTQKNIANLLSVYRNESESAEYYSFGIVLGFYFLWASAYSTVPRGSKVMQWGAVTCNVRPDL
jgi:hypothetical protein